jgi:hypothetical protein
MVAADVPTLNQNTTGSAGSLASGGFANPTGTVGLTVVNGSALTAMRSDAAPPLSQAITPTWTGVHIFKEGATGTPIVQINGTSGGWPAYIAFSGNGGTYGTSSFVVGQDGANNAAFYNGAGTAMNFSTNSALALQITSTGQTVAQQVSTGTPALQVNSTGGWPAYAAFTGNGVAEGASSFVVGQDGAQNATLYNGANAAMNFSTDGSLSMALSAAGVVTFSRYGAGTLTTNGSGVISASSDRRIKRDIVPFMRGLNAILDLEPATYSYTKASGLDDGGRYTGFIAQNVRDAIPEAVGEANGLLTLSDRPIIAALVNAVHTLNARLCELEKAA